MLEYTNKYIPIAFLLWFFITHPISHNKVFQDSSQKTSVSVSTSGRPISECLLTPYSDRWFQLKTIKVVVINYNLAGITFVYRLILDVKDEFVVRCKMWHNGVSYCFLKTVKISAWYSVRINCCRHFTAAVPDASMAASDSSFGALQRTLRWLPNSVSTPSGAGAPHATQKKTSFSAAAVVCIVHLGNLIP